MKRQLFAAASLLLICNASAQVNPWILPGNTGTDPSSDFVGTTDNKELVLRTDGLFRFRLNKTETYGTLGAFSSIPANGFGLLTPNGSFINNAPGPYTLLHLAAADGNAQQDSYRPWMSTGITLTGNRDHQYIGQKAGELDYTDLVIHWSDNPGEFLKDRLRFIFTSGYDAGAASGAQSTEGLEFMRFFPDRYENPLIGVGDFYAANLADPTVTEPTERLDMVNGRLRIRQLPDDPAAVDSFYVMVVDRTVLNQNNQERGVVKWVDPSVFTGGGGADCDWTVQNASTSGPTVPHHVFTASGTSDACPDRDDMVGIGAPPSAAKLHVQVNRAADQAPPRGLRVELLPAANDVAQGGNISVGGASAAGGISHVGLTSATYNGTAFNKGLVGNALRDQAVSYSDVNYGVEGLSQVSAGTMNVAAGLNADAVVGASATVSNNFGVRARSSRGVFGRGVSGESLNGSLVSIGTDGYAANAGQVNVGARGNAVGNGTFNVGVWGSVSGDSSSANWAGYFVGDVMITGNGFVNGGIPITSDIQFKTELGAIEDPLATLGQLRPRSYAFNDLGRTRMDLPDGRHMGFIAQELEEVIPGLVHQTERPGSWNETGEQEVAPISFKAVNYIGLIPLIVAAMQEQQAQLEQLREQLAACCNRPTGSDHRMAPATGSSAPDELLLGKERLLRIAPNPFTDRTTLHCTLERGGRVQLLANSADGRDLRVLHEAQREAGDFQYEWSTVTLAPGVYYVTLLLDGEPLVKRAVKVGG